MNASSSRRRWSGSTGIAAALLLLPIMPAWAETPSPDTTSASSDAPAEPQVEFTDNHDGTGRFVIQPLEDIRFEYLVEGDLDGDGTFEAGVASGAVEDDSVTVELSQDGTPFEQPTDYRLAFQLDTAEGRQDIVPELVYGLNGAPMPVEIYLECIPGSEQLPITIDNSKEQSRTLRFEVLVDDKALELSDTELAPGDTFTETVNVPFGASMFVKTQTDSLGEQLYSLECTTQDVPQPTEAPASVATAQNHDSEEREERGNRGNEEGRGNGNNGRDDERDNRDQRDESEGREGGWRERLNEELDRRFGGGEESDEDRASREERESREERDRQSEESSEDAEGEPSDDATDESQEVPAESEEPTAPATEPTSQPAPQPTSEPIPGPTEAPQPAETSDVPAGGSEDPAPSAPAPQPEVTQPPVQAQPAPAPSASSYFIAAQPVDPKVTERTLVTPSPQPSKTVEPGDVTVVPAEETGWSMRQKIGWGAIAGLVLIGIIMTIWAIRRSSQRDRDQYAQDPYPDVE